MGQENLFCVESIILGRGGSEEKGAEQKERMVEPGERGREEKGKRREREGLDTRGGQRICEEKGERSELRAEKRKEEESCLRR